jgi:hypothetical protein
MTFPKMGIIVLKLLKNTLSKLFLTIFKPSLIPRYGPFFGSKTTTSYALYPLTSNKHAKTIP